MTRWTEDASWIHLRGTWRAQNFVAFWRSSSRTKRWSQDRAGIVAPSYMWLAAPPRGVGIDYALQCGIQQCGQTLSFSGGGGRNSHPGRTGTRGGLDPGSFLRGWWTPGLMGTRVDAVLPRRPHRIFPVDWPGGQCCQVKDYDFWSEINYIINVTGVICLTQHGGGSHLPGMSV